MYVRRNLTKMPAECGIRIPINNSTIKLMLENGANRAHRNQARVSFKSAKPETNSLLPLSPTPKLARRDTKLIRSGPDAFRTRLRQNNVPFLRLYGHTAGDSLRLDFQLWSHHRSLVLRHYVYEEMLEFLVESSGVALGSAEDTAILVAFWCIPKRRGQ